MRRDSLFKREELFVSSAVIAAHAQNVDEGFRQRDVRFFIELFSNWVESVLDDLTLTLSNTQVSRYINELVDEGFSRQISRKKQPKYRLTRIGLIELLSRLVEKDYVRQPEYFFFLYYFIANYGPRLKALIESEGRKFPPAMRIEVETMLDVDALVGNQLANAERELKKLDERIRDASQASKLAAELLSKGLDNRVVQQEVERKYPYELNSQKPLTELLSSLSEEHSRWELEVGSLRRVEHIWLPARTQLLSYIQVLKRLKQLVVL